MIWKKVPDATKAWCGGISAKTLYRAIRDGKCRAARIGSGRNYLVCEQFVDDWLAGSARNDAPRKVAAEICRVV